MKYRANALAMVNAERNRQDAKWGKEDHDPALWVGILGEEYGEYCQAVNETVFNNGPDEREKGGYENMMRELTHVAAVAVSAMECLMRNAGKQVPEPFDAEGAARDIEQETRLNLAAALGDGAEECLNG